MNALLALLLRSPFHRLTSGSLMLLTFTGRRSGRRFRIPVQYVRMDSDVLVLAGHPQRKQWWRNFRGSGGAILRIAGQEVAATGRVVAGRDEPNEANRLLHAYLSRFPRAAGTLGIKAASDGLAVAKAARDTVFVVFARGNDRD